MTGYRVTFFKQLVNSHGHPFKCPQEIIVVHRAKSEERALRAAQYRYERAMKCSWKAHADFASAEPLPNA